MNSAKSAEDLTQLRSLVDHLESAAALLDDKGSLVHANASWRRVESPALLVGPAFAAGCDYAAAVAKARPQEPRLVAALNDAVRALRDGRTDELAITYATPVRRAEELPELHTLRLTVLTSGSFRALLVVHRRRSPDLYGAPDMETSSERAASLELAIELRTEELRRVNEQLRSDIEARALAEKARQDFEQELLLSQKLEGIGRLAGGIAHDFNNLLTIILAYGQQSLAKLDPTKRERAYVTEMVAAAQRAAELTRQLLAFARKQVIEPRVVDLNEIILAVDGMLRALLGSDIELVTLPSAERCPVVVDPGQFERIILNLAANARDAMPSGGKLVIAVEPVSSQESSTIPGLSKPGAYARLTVSDTGQGIPREVLPEVFDPFFTTKTVGAGTGLGLATCYGIVKQAGGHIAVESTLDQGTAFEIYLPRTDGELAAPSSVGPATSRGTETILVVDDEPRLRTITAELLREEGYRVLEAASGDEAVRVAEATAHRIDLLLSDLVMPHMSGRAAAAKIAERRQGIRVLFMSGYADANFDTDVDRSAFLAKPFTREALLTKLRDMFDKR